MPFLIGIIHNIMESKRLWKCAYSSKPLVYEYFILIDNNASTQLLLAIVLAFVSAHLVTLRYVSHESIVHPCCVSNGSSKLNRSNSVLRYETCGHRTAPHVPAALFANLLKTPWSTRCSAPGSSLIDVYPQALRASQRKENFGILDKDPQRNIHGTLHSEFIMFAFGH